MKNYSDIQKQEKITELIELKNFRDLTLAEKTLVTSMLNESEYQLRRNVVLNAQSMFATANEFRPKPLILPSKQATLMSATIPLYQALLGLAAMFILMFWLYPFTQTVVSQQTHQIAVVDTLKIETVKYDTISIIVEKPVIKERIVYVNKEPDMINIVKEERRLLDVPPSNFNPDLTSSAISNKGRSYKEDTLRLSLPSIN